MAAPLADPPSPTRRWLAERRRRLGFVLTRPWLLWTLAAIFWARLAFFAVLEPQRPDGVAILAAARALLLDPAQVYAGQADFLARHHVMAPHGFLGPPGGLFLAAPFAVLPSGLGLSLWTLGDAAALVGGLLFVFAALRPTGWRRPLYFLVAGYFPPVFADIDAGQLGGYLLLLAGAAIWLNARRRPGWAGVLAGVAAAVKLYPAAMLIGAGPRRLARFAGGMAAAAAVITVAGFGRLGAGGVSLYVGRVLLPSLGAPLRDCELDSPRTLISRTIGGDPYPYINPSGGLTIVRLPLHEPALAAVLTYVLLAAIVAAGIWAAARSGWHPVYGLAVGLALGALLPGEVNVYQMLPLLPLVLATVVRAGEAGRTGVLVALGVALVALVQQPCYLPFPDLWTLALLALYAICLWNNGLFRRSDRAAGGAVDGAQ